MKETITFFFLQNVTSSFKTLQLIFQQYTGNYEPSWVKFKYGAWYLDPKTWQKRDSEQPLMDPKALKDQEMSEAKKKSKELVSSFIATNVPGHIMRFSMGYL